MYAQVDDAVEDAVGSGEHDFANVHVELVGEYTCHLVHQSSAVNAAHAQGNIEEVLLLHVPLGIEDAVAVAGLEPVGRGACPLVYLNLVLGGDVA